MDAPGATNHVLQEVCPDNTSEHTAVAFDPVAAQLTFNALDPPDARPIDCDGLPEWNGRQAPDPEPEARLPVVPTRAAGLAWRYRVRRLLVGPFTPGAIARLTCATPRTRTGLRYPCPFADKRGRFAAGRRGLALTRLFAGRLLAPGTTIRFGTIAPGMRAKVFTLRVGRGGFGRASAVCLSAALAPAAC